METESALLEAEVNLAYLERVPTPAPYWDISIQMRTPVALSFKKFFIFRERGREGERKGEKHQCVVASHEPPTGDLAHSSSMCLDWESK